MTSLVNDIQNADKFLDGDTFFSTYASAQEVVSGIFQPSGTDYIIHVLGDTQREKYLSDFKKGDFRYTAVINETLTHWESWVLRANWFLYRELYRKWHPVYFNEYEIYWERNEERKESVLTGDYSICIENVNDTEKKVIIETDPSINGIADVFLDYEVKKNSRKSAKLLFQRMLKVENTGIAYEDDGWWESNFLRDTSAEYVPVRIVNGYGEITLTSQPVSGTYLVLNDVTCREIYPVVYDYIQVSELKNSGNETVLQILDHEKNRTILKEAKGILIKGQECPILRIRADEELLYVTIETSGVNIGKDILSERNIFQIVR